MDWKVVAAKLRSQAADLQKMVATEPAERGRAIGSAGIVLACLATALEEGTPSTVPNGERETP